MNRCAFSTHGSCGDGREFVVCIECGRRLCVPADHVGRVSAKCRGRVEQSGRDSTPLAGGPGTELKAMLAGWPFRMEIVPGCTCLATAAQMDAWGPDVCAEPERMAWIVGRLRAEAEARRVPFLDAAARLLVQRAIVRARRAAATRTAAEDAAARR